LYRVNPSRDVHHVGVVGVCGGFVGEGLERCDAMRCAFARNDGTL
jgi:hypothetical protein